MKCKDYRNYRPLTDEEVEEIKENHPESVIIMAVKSGLAEYNGSPVRLIPGVR
jgi:hypothetical protein